MRLVRNLLAVLLLPLTVNCLATDASDVKSFTLENDMKFLVLEDSSIPNANLYLFWKVGSRNEYPGITGLSHFFEHMMFNGAKKYGPKMFDRTMEAAGGANNAYTTENLTVYTDWFPSSSIETIFDLEADRIRDLALDDAMIESERGVVTSERSTGLENSNFRRLSEEVKGAAFRAHPYSWSVIGHQSDIDNWSKADLQNYFDTYYAPNNAVAVVVGDVEFAQVKKLAEQYFGDIPKGPAPREVHTVEPEQSGEKRVFVKKPSVSSPNIMIGYKVPETSSADYYALDMLTSILGDGNTSRFHQALVDQDKLATDVFAYMPESFDPNLLYLYAVASKDAQPAAVEKRIYQIIKDIQENGVSEQELQKTKNQKRMAFYNTMETINGKANNIGTYEVFFDGYQALFDAPDKYNQVTVADIKRVANEYLIKSRRTVGILDTEEPADEL